MLLWAVLLFIVDKSGWCYCGLRCCLLWISQAGVIVGCVAVCCGSVRLVLLWSMLLFIVDQTGVVVVCVAVYCG